MSLAVKEAAIYARISKDRYGTGQTVARQVAECRTYAEAHGHAVAEVYVDNDISAYRRKPRPDYRRMCDDLKAGTRDGVVTFHLDRLHRNMIELEEFINLIEATRADVRTVSGGDYDLSTSDGRAMARVVATFARKESEDKSRRIKSQIREQAQQGRRNPPGTRGYGYNKDHTQIVPTEAVVIREAAERILAGEALRSLCNDLNDRGIRTAKGAAWTMTTMSRILTAGRISGQVEHLGEIVTSGDWPAILTPTQTTRLRTMLRDPARRTNRAPRTYPLSGLVRCGLCGARMGARPRADRSRRYACNNQPGNQSCGRMSTLAEPLESFIIAAVLFRLDTPDLERHMVAAAQDTDADALQHQIDDDKAQLESLAALYGKREIGVAEWLAARKPIEARMADASRQMGRLTHSSALDGYVGRARALRDQWSHFSVPRQHAIISALVDHVTVHPAVKGRPRFDPDRIEVCWQA